MDFFNQKNSNQPQAVAILPLPYSERSIALGKTTIGSPKGAEIDPNLPHR
jgi:hypothetical protein